MEAHHGTLSRPATRISVQILPQHAPIRTLINAATRLEDMGVSRIYNWDHFYPIDGDRQGLHFECWTLLAAWAEATSTIEIGPLVTNLSIRSSADVISMAKTLDEISGRRFVLGLGAGWRWDESESYGFKRPAIGSVHREFADSVRVIAETLIRNDGTKMPIIVGGRGLRRTAEIAARYADIWHIMFPENSQQIESSIEVNRVLSERIGRTLSPKISLGIKFNELARRLNNDANHYSELGVSEITLALDLRSPDYYGVASWLKWSGVGS